MNWTCPICNQTIHSTIDKIREAYGSNDVPAWFCERAGRRSIGLSHIMKDHPYHMRRDKIIKEIKDESNRDLERIVRLQKAGIVYAGNPFAD